MEEKRCLKCGRPCREDQAFCGECLAEMERYPVKPGVVVLLPQQERNKPTNRRRHTAPSPEEQLARLKKRISALRVALVLSLAALGVSGWIMVSAYLADENAKPLPGQNYSAETSAETDENQ